MTEDLLSLFLVVAILLVFQGGARFNTPSTSRSMTTAARYYFGLGVYLVLPLLLYVASFGLLVQTPWLAIWWGLFLAILLPRLPLVRGVDGWVRSKAHAMAGIPRSAMRLASELAQVDVEASPEVLEETRLLLSRRGQEPEAYAENPSLYALWCKTSTLFVALRTWEKCRRRRRFLRLAGLEYKRIRSRWDQLSLRVTRFANAVDRLNGMVSEPHGDSEEPLSLESMMDRELRHVDPRIEKPVEATKRVLNQDMREDLERFLRELCEFIARGVFSRKRTVGGRFKELRAFGFRVEEQPRFASLGLAFTIVTVVMLVSVLTLAEGRWSANQTAIMVPMIAATQLLALMVATLPKLRYPFANRDIFGRKPYRFILGSGIAAVILCVPLRLVFKRFLTEWDGVLNALSRDWPWLIMSFTTALLTAALVQDKTWPASFSRSKQRLLDGLVLGLGLAIGIAVVLPLLAMIGATPPPWRVVLVAFVMGFLLGWFVPWSFRATPLPSRRPRNRRLEPISIGDSLF